MSQGPAPAIILTAGGISFTTKWYAARSVDWKIPLATVLLSAGFAGLSDIDKNGATILAVEVLLGACTTPWDGKSFVQLLTETFGTGTPASSSPQTPTNSPLTSPAPPATGARNATNIQKIGENI